jgi:transposase
MERPQQRHGPESRVTAAVEKQLRDLLRTYPNVTLAELREKLQWRLGWYLSIGRLWLALQKMGLRLKRSHSTPMNKTVPKTHARIRSASKL